MKVEIWSDINCPWCYIGKARFEQGLAAFDHGDHVDVEYKSFELDPSLPRGEAEPVLPALARKYGIRLDQAGAAEGRVAEAAHDLGLPYLEAGRDTGNSFDLHRLLHLAKESGKDKGLMDLLFKANFAEPESVFTDREYVVRLSVEAGLDESEVRALLADPTAYAGAVRTDESEGASLDIHGVPFFVFDRRLGVSGAQPPEVFTQVLAEAWGTRSPVLTMAAGAADTDACGPDGCRVGSSAEAHQ
jgi:predicted DsbA family dithiol-disulfide isomerase